MNCPYCGAPMTKGTRFCESCGAAATASPSVDQMLGGGYSQQYYDDGAQGYLPEDYPPMDDIPITVPKTAPSTQKKSKQGRRKPTILLRVPLQLLSLLLSMLLTVCLLATALLADCNRILSGGGIKQMVNALLSPQANHAAIRPVVGAKGGSIRLDNSDLNVDIPTDILTDGDADALVDWVYDYVESVLGEEASIDEDQIRDFVNDSTVTDYLAEKAAGYAEDFINGTQDTLITSEELMELLEENESLIESTFQVQITDDMKSELKVAFQQTIEDNKLNEVIHEQVLSSLHDAIDNALPNMDWESIQSVLKMLTDDHVLLMAAGVCVVLLLLLCALNFYNIPAGLTWGASSCITAGIILSIPMILVQALPSLLTDTIALPSAMAQMLNAFLSAFAAVHYGILFIGAVLLVLSIVLRVIRASRS